MIGRSVMLALAPVWWPEDRSHTGDRTSDIVPCESSRSYGRAHDRDQVKLGCMWFWNRANRLPPNVLIGTSLTQSPKVEITP
jgi:hypothetical protein